MKVPSPTLGRTSSTNPVKAATAFLESNQPIVCQELQKPLWFLFAAATAGRSLKSETQPDENRLVLERTRRTVHHQKLAARLTQTPVPMMGGVELFESC